MSMAMLNAQNSEQEPEPASELISITAGALRAPSNQSPSPPPQVPINTNVDYAHLSNTVKAALYATGNGVITCPGHSRPVPDLSFTSLSDEGYFMISSCLDSKAMVRDGITGDWIGTFIGHKGATWCSRFNADNSLAATASADFSAKLWNALSGDEITSFKHKHIVKSLAFSKEVPYRLYTGGHEKKLRIFDLNAYDAEPQIADALDGTINSIIPHSDPNLLFVAGAAKDVRLYDIRTSSAELKLSTPSKVSNINLSNDGSILACSSGRDVVLYDARSLTSIKTVSLAREIDCLAFDRRLNRLVTGSNSELWVRVYDGDSFDEIACNKGHHGPVRCIAFAPHGLSYATGSEDGTIRIWGFADVRLPVEELDSVASVMKPYFEKPLVLYTDDDKATFNDA